MLHGCPIVDDVLLVVDELVVNALRHTRSGQGGGTFAVEIRQQYAEVVVTDQGCATEPTPTDAEELAESGRGLRTVSLLATSWGWHGNTAGRTITAVFTAEPTGVVRLSDLGPEREWPPGGSELAGAPTDRERDVSVAHLSRLELHSLITRLSV